MKDLLATLQENGFESLADFQEYFYNNGGLITFLQEQILAEVTVGDNEIKEYYNNNPDYFKDDEREG